MSLEDRIHLKATERFINENPSVVYLVRTTRVSDGAGGTIDGVASLTDPILIRLVGVSTQRADHHSVSENGAVRAPSIKAIAMPGTDLLVGDQFVVNATRYEVLSTNTNPPWRLEAEVYVHG